MEIKVNEMKKIILLLVIIFLNSCSVNNQISTDRLYMSIGDFYFQNKEITNELKLEVYKKNYVVIDKKFGNDNLGNGLYFISLSITHTTFNLLIISNQEYYIIKIDKKVHQNFRKVFDNKIKVALINDLFNKNEFQEELKRLNDYNYRTKSKRTLMPLFSNNR